MNKIQLTTRGRYAVMAMVELAKHQEKSPLPLSEIATNGDISLSYLEQLTAGLRRHKLVKSYRGPGGGYILAKTPDAITVVEILNAAEDSTPAQKNKKNKGKNKKSCPHTQQLWDHIEETLYTQLKDITLDDVLKNNL